uniref:Uncharacterized protein n=1 Tax=Strigops habroptila TaxID=2489341 RepID=A0A672TV53_STRHB
MSVAWQMDGPRGADPLVRKSEGPTGAHVVGCLDTYRALEQHILEGKALARELMCLTRPALGLPNCLLPGKEALGWTGTGHLWGSASTLHGILEQCVSLLTAFWSTVLPVSPAQHQGKEQALQGEIAALRAQLSEREDALQSTAERLRSTAQLKDSMEQFIVSQCTWPRWQPAVGWQAQAGLVPMCLGWLYSTRTSLTTSLSPSQ